MNLPPPRRDCTNDCGECDLGDACRSFPVPEPEHRCPHCDVKAWHADLVIEDGEGGVTETTYYECPACHHMWVPGVSTPYNGTY